jgi:hypothetical protein
VWTAQLAALLFEFAQRAVPALAVWRPTDLSFGEPIEGRTPCAAIVVDSSQTDELPRPWPTPTFCEDPALLADSLREFGQPL